MKSKRWVGVLLGAAFACAAQPSLAEDKGKTAAAELARASRRQPCSSCTSSAPLAKQLGPVAHAILVFPEGHEGRARNRRPVWRGRAPAEGQGGRLLQDHRGLGRAAGGGQQYGYAMFFMNAKALDQLDSAKGFEVGVGPSPRPGGRGHGEDHHDQHPQGRHLRLRLRPEGADGGARPPGQQDHEDHPEVVGPAIARALWELLAGRAADRHHGDVVGLLRSRRVAAHRLEDARGSSPWRFGRAPSRGARGAAPRRRAAGRGRRPR